MSFRLTNTITNLYNNIKKILVKKLDLFILVYFDNIKIYIDKKSYIIIV